MPRSFLVVVAVVTLFIGFMLGYSIPPFLQAGVFSDRENKGVAVEISEDDQDYYKNLYQDDDDDE